MTSTNPGTAERVLGRTVAERVAAGKAARAVLPRTAMGEFTPAVDRPNPVTTITDQEADLVAELVPLRHQRMSANPFAFLRGAAAVMASDLGSRPNSGLIVQLCGDAHLSNLGIFAGPDRSLVFDINDFDETAPGPFEWDVLRLATSFSVAAVQAGHSQKFADSLPLVVGNAYRDAMASFADMNELDMWYYRIDSQLMHAWVEGSSDQVAAKKLRKTEDAARSRDRWSAVRKLTHLEGDQRRFNDQPPLLASLGMDDQARPVVEKMFDEYTDSLLVDRQALLHRYRVIDVGHKVVGVGSVGLLAFVILLQGRDDEDLLVLQVKQAVDSVLSPYTHLPVISPPGRRVVEGQQLMQAASDAFLGYVNGSRGRAYYVRQLRDMKWSPDPLAMAKDGYLGYAALCGGALARAHARAGDAIAISAYIGKSDAFAASVGQFAQSYRALNARDFEEFTGAISRGVIDSETDSKRISLGVDTDGSVVIRPQG